MITVVGNLKGGCGKSTVTFNFAVWLALRGAKVAIYDLDPQRTISDVIEVRNEEAFEPRVEVHHSSTDLAQQLQHADGEILIDVGIADIEAMRTAITLADRIVIPVPPSQADLWSTQRFLGMINEFTPERTPSLYLFVNRADTHHAVRESDETEEALAALNSATLLTNRLHQRTAYRRSFSEGLGVFELQGDSKAAIEFNQLASLLYPDFVR